MEDVSEDLAKIEAEAVYTSELTGVDIDVMEFFDDGTNVEVHYLMQAPRANYKQMRDADDGFSAYLEGFFSRRGTLVESTLQEVDEITTEEYKLKNAYIRHIIFKK